MTSIEQGAVIAGKYELTRALARGGMGSVWVCRHRQLDVQLAIKFMAGEHAMASDLRDRFAREAKAAALLQSPHIVQVHDYGLEGEIPYIVMELLHGEDLEARLMREGRLSLPATAKILGQACRGLRRAHDAGIVHRDLKPANIFLVRADDDELVKVLDFGIAKVMVPDEIGKATKTGMLMGSPHYMSPEQARGAKTVDHRTDLWALGVILFRCVTGKLPFPGEQLGDILVAICADPIPAASAMAPDLGPEVDRFFQRALMRDTAQRFQSVREIAEAFSALAGAEAPPLAPSLVKSQPIVAVATTPGLGPHDPPEPNALGSGPRALGSGAHAIGHESTIVDLNSAVRPAQPAPPAEARGGTLGGTGGTVPPRSGRRGLILAAVAVVVLGIGGFAVWRVVLPSSAMPPGTEPSVSGVLGSGAPAASTQAPAATSAAASTAAPAVSEPSPSASAALPSAVPGGSSSALKGTLGPKPNAKAAPTASATAGPKGTADVWGRQ